MQKTVFKKYSLCFFFFAMLQWHSARAQYEEKDFVRYTIKDGLSNSYINCLQQDSRGYLWAGTDEGLNRFDGNSFTNYFQGSVSLPLASSNIFNLKMMGPTQLGIINRGGFQLLNTLNFTVKNFFVPDSGSFNRYRNGAWDAVLLTDQSLALTTNAGFYVFSSNGQLIFRHDAYKPEDVGKKTIRFGREIFPVNEKECLVYTEAFGLSYFNAEKKYSGKLIPQKYYGNRFTIPSPPPLNSGTGSARAN